MAKLSRRYQRSMVLDWKRYRLKTDDQKLPSAVRRAREHHAKEKKHAEGGSKNED